MDRACSKTRSPIGRKEVRYRCTVDGRNHVGERVIVHVDDFDPLDVGDPIMLRIDPKEPQFSVTALDVAPSLLDRIPVALLIALVYTAGGLAALCGLFLRRILRYGIEVPCTVQATHSPSVVRVTYAWRGVTRTRRVEGKCTSEGEPGAVLLDPAFPAWPLLGMHCRFNPGPTTDRLHSSREGIAAINPASVCKDNLSLLRAYPKNRDSCGRAG